MEHKQQNLRAYDWQTVDENRANQILILGQSEFENMRTLEYVLDKYPDWKKQMFVVNDSKDLQGLQDIVDHQIASIKAKQAVWITIVFLDLHLSDYDKSDVVEDLWFRNRSYYMRLVTICQMETAISPSQRMSTDLVIYSRPKSSHSNLDHWIYRSFCRDVYTKHDFKNLVTKKDTVVVDNRRANDSEILFSLRPVIYKGKEIKIRARLKLLTEQLNRIQFEIDQLSSDL